MISVSEGELQKMEEELCMAKEKNHELCRTIEVLKAEVDSVRKERNDLEESLQLAKAGKEQSVSAFEKHISFLEGAIDAYQYALNSRR